MHNNHLSRCLAVLFAILSVPLRLLSGMGLVRYNLHPVGSLGIYGGGKVGGWLAYVLPLIVMVATDLALYFLKSDATYSPLHVSRLVVYPCFALYVLMGRWLVINNNPLRIGGAALAGSLLFFLFTNFASWVEYSHLYSRDLTGLVNALIAGWPFYQSTLVSDLAFTAGFFGIHALATRAASAKVAEIR